MVTKIIRRRKIKRKKISKEKIDKIFLTAKNKQEIISKKINNKIVGGVNIIKQQKKNSRKILDKFIEVKNIKKNKFIEKENFLKEESKKNKSLENIKKNNYKFSKKISKRLDVIKKIKPIKMKKIKKKKIFIKLILIFLILSFLVIGAVAIWISNLTIPSVDEIHRLNISQATKIFDRNGELLYNIYGDEKRTVVEISEISPHLAHAAVAIEDKDFYNHSGIKISSILKAAWQNFKAGHHIRGGSTITQQLIKNTILTREKTYTRKIKEAILAYKLEKIWTKEQILELYLNESPYGGTIYGAEEAAQYYFGIPASELDIAQAAYLAAMPQAPTKYSPYGSHKKELDARKNLVLKLMLNQNYINSDEYQEAKTENVTFVFKSDETGIRAPHFVMYVIDKLKEKYTDEQLKTEGLRVYTTLDLELQDDLQKIVKEQALENERKYHAENASVVVIDSKTGNILAMVGSRDYFDKKIDGKVNIATAKRQPGSSFKPIVYLSALQKGYTPETVVWDVPTEFSYQCNPDHTKKRENATCYHPQNFDHKFKGPMELRYALPESRNIPAVKFLYLVGLEKALKNAKLLGIKSLNKPASYYGLNLVLGGGEVQLLNLVSAYSVFSNQGLRVEPNVISKIKDTKGKVLEENILEKIRVMDENEILQLTEILSTNEYKYKTFGINSPLYYTNRQVAVKTGTTDNYRDAWTVGYDPSVAVGVWVGNNDNKSMKPSKAAHLLWRASMDRVLKDYPNIDFRKPEDLDYAKLKPSLRGLWQGNKVIRIDTKNKTLATEETPEEFIQEIIIPEYHSILHWVNKDNPNGPVPKTIEERDDLYENWEAGVQSWVGNNKKMVSDEIAKLLKTLLELKPLDENTVDVENSENQSNNEEIISDDQEADLEAQG